jgi:hypothetical protein
MAHNQNKMTQEKTNKKKIVIIEEQEYYQIKTPYGLVYELKGKDKTNFKRYYKK